MNLQFNAFSGPYMSPDGRSGFTCSQKNRSVGNSVIVMQHHGTDQDFTLELPENLDKIETLEYYSDNPDAVFEKPVDLVSKETTRVLCAYQPTRENPTPSNIPFILTGPSHHLKAILLVNYPVTQELVDFVAACPNLERAMFRQEIPAAFSADVDPVLHIPAPRFLGVESWVFQIGGVTSVESWYPPNLRVLALNGINLTECPQRLLSGGNLLYLDFRNNKLELAAAKKLLRDCPSLRFTDLSNNLIEDIPFPDKSKLLDICYHSSEMMFGFHSAHFPSSLGSVMPQFEIDWRAAGHLEAEYYLVEKISRMSMKSSYMRSCVGLDGNPMLVTEHPQFFGYGAGSPIGSTGHHHTVTYHWG